MKALSEAIAHIAMEVHPERIEAICSALAICDSSKILPSVRATLGSTFPPRMVTALQIALQSCPQITPSEVIAMFRASCATSTLVSAGLSIELVWTGPKTGLVPVRHTAQVLTGLIDDVSERLFIVCYVAYHVADVFVALQRASERGVSIKVLLELHKEAGGNVNVDSIGLMRQHIPTAQIYRWKKAIDTAPNASVHAKCAVADGAVAFITSANFSEAAMERNMELGVLVRGGNVPRLLDLHLAALISTDQITLV